MSALVHAYISCFCGSVMRCVTSTLSAHVLPAVEHLEELVRPSLDVLVRHNRLSLPGVGPHRDYFWLTAGRVRMLASRPAASRRVARRLLLPALRAPPPCPDVPRGTPRHVRCRAGQSVGFGAPVAVAVTRWGANGCGDAHGCWLCSRSSAQCGGGSRLSSRSTEAAAAAPSPVDFPRRQNHPLRIVLGSTCGFKVSGL